MGFFPRLLADTMEQARGIADAEKGTNKENEALSKKVQNVQVILTLNYILRLR